jgi:hypothetical protein
VHSVTEKVKFIEDIFGSSKFDRSCRNLDVRCPICNPIDKNKRKLSIRIDDDRNHCWTCGWRAKTLAPLIAKYAGRNYLADYIEKYAKHLKNTQSCKSIQVNEENIVKLPNDFTPLLSSKDPDKIAVLNYVKNQRNLSNSNIIKYFIGASNDTKWRRRAIVPSFDSFGKVNYYVARSIDKKSFPKYQAADRHRDDVIFNEINIDWSQPVILCEGVFDMFSCGENAIPILGSDISENSLLFNKLITICPQVILALDGDMWLKKTMKIAKKLNSYNVAVKLVDTRKIEDPGSVTENCMLDLIAHAKDFSWEDRISDKLDYASKTSLSL